MKKFRITTESGSVYLVREETHLVNPADKECSPERTVLFINQESALKNPNTYPGKEHDGWQGCTITPWPPRLGYNLYVSRPDVPWGQGQFKVTSTVRTIEEVV